MNCKKHTAFWFIYEMENEMATISWKFTWRHNNEPQSVMITGAKKQSEALDRLANMLADQITVGDTISSWIEIENQRTMTKAYIKPQSVITDFAFEDETAVA